MTLFHISESPYTIRRVLLCEDHMFYTEAADCSAAGYHTSRWAYVLHSHGSPCYRSNGDMYVYRSYSGAYSTAKRFSI